MKGRTVGMLSDRLISIRDMHTSTNRWHLWIMFSLGILLFLSERHSTSCSFMSFNIWGVMHLILFLV